MTADHLPPHNLDAERAVIGSCLQDRDIIGKLADILPSDAFYDSSARTIWRAMLSLFRDRIPCDLLTTTDRLSKSGVLDRVGGMAQLTDLMLSVPVASHAEYYAGQVLETARQRAIIRYGSDLVAQGYQRDLDIDEAASGLRAAVQPFTPEADDTETFGSISDLIGAHTAKVVDRWEGRLVETVIPTGLRSLDRILYGGLRPGELVYLGGRPGMGKTSMAMQIAMSAAKRSGKTVLVSELEMSPEALLNRVIAAEARLPFGIAYQTIGSMADRNRWLEAADRIAEIPVNIQSLATTSKIIAFAEKANAVNPIGMIIIDHQSLLSDQTKIESPQAHTAEVSNRCKRMAMDLQVPVIVLTQLNRDVENHPPYVPTIRNIINSGMTEANADLVLFPYRRRYYSDPARKMLDEDQAKDFITASNMHTVELHVAKYRNGEATVLPLGWAPESMSFHEVAA
jgi:replicative DNA helicase